MEPLLICTDFDGTIATHDDIPPFAPTFFEQIQALRKKRKVIWTINTGREWEGLSEALMRRECEIWPDWVILIERYIYRVENQAVIPLQPWNTNCVKTHDKLFNENTLFFNSVEKKYKNSKAVQIIPDQGSPFGLLTDTEKEADEVEVFLQSLLPKGMDYVRNSTCFRFAHKDYNKGTCLSQLGEYLETSASQRFAIGDHLNDISMLQTLHAQYVACPSNATETVKLQIAKNKGYIATQPVHLGVVEALNHFFK
jgi:hydroxymethylpyrimidine pyrophosphatase-like HAD family hydrolase